MSQIRYNKKKHIVSRVGTSFISLSIFIRVDVLSTLPKLDQKINNAGESYQVRIALLDLVNRFQGPHPMLQGNIPEENHTMQTIFLRECSKSVRTMISISNEDHR